MTNKMKEELTTKMHNEFTISKETEIKHRVFAICTRYYPNMVKLIENRESYNVTIEQINKYLPVWKAL